MGLYFLLGELSEVGMPRVYIGQSGSVGNRLVQHNQNKDFWSRALVVISLTNSLTQTHALFLVWFAIQKATQAGRDSLENSNTGARPIQSACLATNPIEISIVLACSFSIWRTARAAQRGTFHVRYWGL